MGEFNFEKLVDFFLGEIRKAHSTGSTEKAQEYLQPQIESKLAEFTTNLELNPELKSILEFSFRKFFSELLEGANTRGESVVNAGAERLIELVLWCANEGLVDAPAIFPIFEDLFDSQTIDGCRQLFFLLESRASVLANDMFVGEGRGRNLLLKVCTDLLKRLSKTNNAEFCGRILVFLAYVFPLSDRSGLNVKSEPNFANVTSFEEAIEGDKMELDKSDNPIDNTNGPIDYNFYRTFWSLHSYFQNFQILFQHPDKWSTLIKGIELVLTAFAGNSNLAEVAQSQNQQHFTKYLTSSNLMKLQLKDSSFRRHILLQILILFQALTVPIAKAPAAKDTLNPKQKQTIQELSEKVKELLEGTHPNGPEFTQTVFDALQRENNWITWKRDNCKPFEKSVAGPSNQGSKVTAKRAGSGGDKFRLGNAELSRLWNLAKDDHEFLVHSSRNLTPSVEEFLGPIEDGSYKAFDEDATRLYTWKALRLVAKSHFRYFGELHGTSASIEDLAKILEKEKNGGADKSKEDSATSSLDEVPEGDKEDDTDMKDVDSSQGTNGSDNGTSSGELTTLSGPMAVKEEKEDDGIVASKTENGKVKSTSSTSTTPTLTPITTTPPATPPPISTTEEGGDPPAKRLRA